MAPRKPPSPPGHFGKAVAIKYGTWRDAPIKAVPTTPKR